MQLVPFEVGFMLKNPCQMLISKRVRIGSGVFRVLFQGEIRKR